MAVSLSVVIPVSNQKKDLPAICETLDHGLKSLNFDYEVLVLDHGSRDGSKDLLAEIAARRRAIKFFCHPRRLGPGASLKALLEKVQGDLIVYLDGAFVSGLGSFPVLIEKMRDCDILVASRFGSEDHPAALEKSFLFHFYNFICRVFFNIRIRDLCPKMIFFYKDIIAPLKLRSTGCNVFPEIYVKAKKKNFKVQEHPLDPAILGQNPARLETCGFFDLINLVRIGR